MAGAVLELDWDSNIVWEYRYPLLHHDFERLPNGNTLVLTWELIPEDMVQQVKGGHDSGHGQQGMLGDTVREITPSGEVVYEWNSWEFLGIPGLRGGPDLLPGRTRRMDAPEHPQCHTGG